MPAKPNGIRTHFAFALLLHAAIVFGVSFSAEIDRPSSQTLEVTLAHFDSEQPEKADFLAQNNQTGSGTENEKRELTTDTKGIYADNVIRDALQQKRQVPNPVASTSHTIITSSASEKLELQSDKSPDEEQQKKQSGDAAKNTIDLQIAALEAKLSEQRQAYANRPKIHRITSVSTKAAEDALYQYQWQQMIEAAGNKHYPAAAKNNKLEGDVRLMVILESSGQVKRIKLLKSSGHKALDDAAIASVRNAEPFNAFPAKLRAKADLLEIIRTWQYRGGQLTNL